MPRKGIHPMMQLVRVVFTNGSSVVRPQAWQAPFQRGMEAEIVATKFLETDRLNHESITGVPGRGSREKLGQRAKFENRFVVDAGAGEKGGGKK